MGVLDVPLRVGDVVVLLRSCFFLRDRVASIESKRLRIFDASMYRCNTVEAVVMMERRLSGSGLV